MSDGETPRSGLTAILAATIVAGVAAYLVTWMVPRVIGFADYASFAVFWSALYLVVGALFGLQQEVTRATVRVAPGGAGQVNRARNFGLVAGLVTLVIVISSGPLWVYAVFPSEGWLLAWPFAVGVASYSALTAFAGSLYGLAQWRSAAVLVVTDAALRMAALLVALVFTHDIVILAWCVVAPFALAPALLWPFVRANVVGKAQMDVGYGRLVWNASRTMVAAASSGVMVAGFPLLLGLVGAGTARATLALYILSVTLVRAPLVIVSMSLQGYLLVQFRDAPAHASRRLAATLGLIAALGIVLAALAWAIGPWVFGVLFPGEPLPDGAFLAVLVFSSALLAGLFVSAAAVLARSQHLAFALGWVAAAAVTVLAMLVPWELEMRMLVALTVGPVVGLAVHLGTLVMPIRRTSARAGEETQR